MRIIVRLIWPLLLFNTYAVAQHSWSVGPFVGSNVTPSISGVGWNAGALGSMNFQKRWGIQGQPGALLEKNVGRQNIFSDGTSTSIVEWILYHRRVWMETSMIFVYCPRLSNKVKAMAGLGFSARFLVNATMEAYLSNTNGAGTNSGTISSGDLHFPWNYGVPFQPWDGLQAEPARSCVDA